MRADGLVAAAFVLLLLPLAPGPASADPHPAGWRNHKFNGPSQPVTQAGVTTFHIRDKGCSNVDYGDGRGESDCRNGNVRSVIIPRSEERLGQSIEYSFDIQVGEGFGYGGYFNDNAQGFLPNLWDSRLRIASWEGPAIKNFIYMLKLDGRRGLDFVGRTCVPADRMTEWNSFSMKVRWASDAKGWVKVTCNGEIVYLEEGIATNQAPHCYVTNECDRGVRKNPQRFLFLLGPVMAGFGPEWQKYGKPDQFTAIQPEGITLRMRNISVRQGAELYGPEDRAVVRALQEHLNALGCDVGAADGVPGNRTRTAALSCRTFADGEMPAKLDISTTRAILDLYRRKFPI